MGKRIVIALGGNALGKNLHEQMDAVHVTAKAIADLIEDGHEVVIAHGNGPQVGMIQNAFAASLVARASPRCLRWPCRCPRGFRGPAAWTAWSAPTT